MDRAATLRQAQAALQAGRTGEAQSLLRQLLGQRPGDGEALHGLGLALAQQGRVTEALAALQAAAEALPGHPEIAFNRALALQLAGDGLGAIAGFRRAAELAPGNGAAWRNLGTALLAAEAPAAEASPAFEAALRADPRDAAALQGLGFCHQRQGQAAAALAAFRAAFALASQDLRALGNLAAALLAAGRPADCHALLAGHPGTARSPDLRVAQAEAALLLGQPREAVALLDAALEGAPGQSRALGHLQIALAAAGETARLVPALAYHQLVSQEVLPVPPGFADRPAFHAALLAEVRAAPGLLAEREGKTTRGGLQSGDLARRPGPAASALLNALSPAISRYLSAPVPPWRPAAPPAWRLALWATLLEPGGHQDAHNHPSGVASGVYYLATPDRPGAGELLLGSPPDRLIGRGRLPGLTLQPRTGELVIFPSWLWHRTSPTMAGQVRVSLAFDIIPRRA